VQISLQATDGTTVALTRGGGAGYSSGYGCVDSSSQPLVAVEGTETVQGPDGLDHGYTWSIGYFRLLDLQWTHVATRTGKAASVRTHPRATVRIAAIRTPRIAGRRSGCRRAPLDNGRIWRRRSRPCHAIGPAAAEVAAEQGNRVDGQRNRSRPAVRGRAFSCPRLRHCRPNSRARVVHADKLLRRRLSRYVPRARA
jgi:hypothetical protein